MAFFDDMVGKMTNFGQDVAKKGKNISDTAKLSSELRNLENEKNNCLMQLGQIFYLQYSDVMDAQSRTIKERIDDIALKTEQIQQQIQQLKGVVRCPNCQREVSVNSAFCNFCGTKIEHRGSISWFRAECRIVELIQVDIICIQHFQAGFQIFPELIRILRHRLGRNVYLVPHMRERSTQLFLTVRVSSCRVKKVHPAVIGSPQKFYSVLFADPLDRESAKTILVDCDPAEVSARPSLSETRNLPRAPAHNDTRKVPSPHVLRWASSPPPGADIFSDTPAGFCMFHPCFRHRSPPASRFLLPNDVPQPAKRVLRKQAGTVRSRKFSPLPWNWLIPLLRQRMSRGIQAASAWIL